MRIRIDLGIGDLDIKRTPGCTEERDRYPVRVHHILWSGEPRVMELHRPNGRGECDAFGRIRVAALLALRRRHCSPPPGQTCAERLLEFFTADAGGDIEVGGGTRAALAEAQLHTHAALDGDGTGEHLRHDQRAKHHPRTRDRDAQFRSDLREPSIELRHI